MENRKLNPLSKAGTLLAITLLGMTWNVYGQAPDAQPRLADGSTRSLAVPLFKSKVVRLKEPAARISVGSPDIADILILRSTQLYVLGKDIGTTNVLLWDRRDNLIGTVAVEVTHDLESLKGKLHDILPNESILVYSTQRNIVLAGRVSSIGAMDAAIRMADGYLTQVSTAVDARNSRPTMPPGDRTRRSVRSSTCSRSAAASRSCSKSRLLKSRAASCAAWMRSSMRSGKAAVGASVA